MTHQFAPMKSTNLAENIAARLTEAILTGRVAPGERLNESELARQFKVSRAPIREALQQLKEQGLLLNSPRRGMFVVILDEEDMQKMNSLRLVLEAEALRLAKSNFTPQTERPIRQILRKMETSQPSPAVDATRLDLELHRRIWKLSGNEYLERMLVTLTAPLFAYAILTRPKDEKMRMILDSHRPLLDYLEGKSDQHAERVVFEHLNLRWHDPGRYSSLLPTPLPRSPEGREAVDSVRNLH
ncbi:MAG: GntR family transcriptional regulator [Bryobacteraceae bacterium]